MTITTQEVLEVLKVPNKKNRKNSHLYARWNRDEIADYLPCGKIAGYRKQIGEAIDTLRKRGHVISYCSSKGYRYEGYRDTEARHE